MRLRLEHMRINFKVGWTEAVAYAKEESGGWLTALILMPLCGCVRSFWETRLIAFRGENDEVRSLLDIYPERSFHCGVRCGATLHEHHRTCIVDFDFEYREGGILQPARRLIGAQ